MPGGDNTGPRGEGPMTGRGLGFCSEKDLPGSEIIPGNVGRGYGGRFGMRYGRGGKMGYGFRHGQRRFKNHALQNVSEETLLAREAQILKAELASIQEQLSELKKKLE